MIAAERISDFRLTTNTPQLALTGAYHEDFEENWQRYNGTALYVDYVGRTGLYSLSGRISTPFTSLTSMSDDNTVTS